MDEYLSKKLWCVTVSNHDNEPLKTTIDKGLFYLPNSNVYSTGQFISISQLNSNIQMMCLMLEGIGILATVLKKKFDRYKCITMIDLAKSYSSGRKVFD